MKKRLDSNVPVPKLRHDYRFICLLIFGLALLAEMLMFVHAQSKRLAGEVAKDFSLLLTAENRLSETAKENIMTDLKSFPAVRDVSFISKESLLARLREEDSELVDAVLSTGKNPLPDTWEVRVNTEALINLEQLSSSLLVLDGVADVQYKKQEAWAVRHLLFYSQLTAVALYIAAFAIIVFVLVVLAHEPSVPIAFRTLKTHDLPFFLAGAFGGGLAYLVTLGFLYPVRVESLFWAWTSPLAQVLLVLCCSFLGWTLRRWKLKR